MVTAKHLVPESEGFALDHAWRELTRDAFALWIRLMLEPKRALNAGCKSLARRLGMAHRTFMRHLKELRDKGYLRIVSTGARMPSVVIITRRAMLVGLSQFITL